RHGVPVVAVCGSNSLDPERLHAAGITAAYALLDREPDLQRCLTQAPALLAALGEIIAVGHLAERPARSAEGTTP
ncbi:MAG: glycerate kinase, partial [Nocardioidaceae bacterium]